MVGMRGLDYKERRRQRRRNHIAKDLGSPKYKQQVIPARKKRYINGDHEDEFFFEDVYLTDVDPDSYT